MVVFKKVCLSLSTLVYLFSVVGCGTSASSIAEKGWDKYANGYKDSLENGNLTLNWTYVEELKNVYYKGQYGDYSDSYRSAHTTFYFVYYSENDYTSTTDAERAYYIASSMTSGIVTGIIKR